MPVDIKEKGPNVVMRSMNKRPKPSKEGVTACPIAFYVDNRNCRACGSSLGVVLVRGIRVKTASRSLLRLPTTKTINVQLITSNALSAPDIW